ncbi:FAD-binding protein [Gracilibacillus massiliensis]|uniref:FAD-binding protein n=1 Tax=Gracilibacillus massiliensis TaxID=1564956 RepID=UPI00071CB123|nr:FAD-binding protein [Gracilibacillus massiliensis]
MEQKNWAGNYTYNAKNWYEPETIEQIKEIVKQSEKLRVVGSRHSFNGIADSKETIISLQHLNRVLSLDPDNQTVTVEGGIIYSDLSQYLEEHGFALQNMASLPHISVAGACATATHGSGNHNRSLSDAVVAMEVVTANGELVQFSRTNTQEEMNGAAVALGGLGVVTKLTLNVIPSYYIRQDVYENLPLENLKDNFEEVFSSAYSVSLFNDWQSETFNYAWLKRRLAHPQEPIDLRPTFFGATSATESRHPIPGIGAEHCTEQLGVSGAWLDRLPHFKMEFTPSNGEELQSEYLLPREYAYEALLAINKIKEHIAPLLHISEIRTVAEDQLWMSSCYQQDSVGFHFTWKDNWEEVQKVLPKIEKALEPFNARPHWGKLFTMAPEKVQSLYPKLPDFQQLLKKYDADGKFRNSFMDTYIFRDK